MSLLLCSVRNQMKKEIYYQYYILVDKLEEITWALEGHCNDIDCDHYMYKNLLKKKFRPVLEHSYSCMPSLKRDKEALFRLLSLRKFKKFRYKRCHVCNKNLDSLGDSYTIATFTKPVIVHGKKWYEHKGYPVHKRCKRRVAIPDGWNKMF